MENLEELNKEQVMDLASFFGLKSKNPEVFFNIVKIKYYFFFKKSLKKHLQFIKEYLMENKVPEEYLTGYQGNMQALLELNNEV